MIETVVLSGWLLKWTNLIKGYRKRWFLLQDNLLSYYRSPNAVGVYCRGTFDLTNAHIITPTSHSSFVLVENSGRKHHLKALSDDDKQIWINALNNCISISVKGQEAYGQPDIDSDDSAFRLSRAVNGSTRSSNRFKFFFKNISRSRSRHQVSPVLSEGNSPSPKDLRRIHSVLDDHLEQVDKLRDTTISNNRYSNSKIDVNSYSFPDLLRYNKLVMSGSKKLRCGSGSFGICLSEDDNISDLTNHISKLQQRLALHIQAFSTRLSQIESLVSIISDSEHELSDQPSSTSNSQYNFVHNLISLKAILEEHLSNVKEFQETCHDSLQFTLRIYGQCIHRIRVEKEHRVTLERTLEQLAKQYHNIEIELNRKIASSLDDVTEPCFQVNGSRTGTLTRLSSQDEHQFRHALSNQELSSLQLSDPKSIGNKQFYDFSEEDNGDEYYDALSNPPTPILENEPNLTTSPQNTDNSTINLNQMRPKHTDVNHTFPTTLLPDNGIRASSASLNSLVEESSTSDTEDEALEPLMVRTQNVCTRDLGQPNGLIPSESKFDDESKKPVRKRRTSIPHSPKVALNLWSILKNAIGKDVTKIPLPVNFNEPLSFLQRAVEDFTYSNLLDQAAQVSDPVAQMALVAAFSVSCYATTAFRTGKPFNPLLGETFECDRTDDLGWRSVSEQVSHHPPGCSQHCESLRYGWKVWQDFFLVTKFRGKYLSVFPKGTVNLTFADGSHYTWSKVTTIVHNLIVGTLWIDNCGDVVIENHKNHYKCELQFVSHSYFNRQSHRRVTGFIKDPSNVPVNLIEGKWDNFIECQQVDSNQVPVGEPKLLWKANTLPPNAYEMYNFSQFTIELNEMEEGVAPTDSRHRPDQRLMEQGLWDRANEEKRRLEVKQRNKRFKWEKDVIEGQTTSPLFTPIWFTPKPDIFGELAHVYMGTYWQAKEEQDWNNCPDIY